MPGLHERTTVPFQGRVAAFVAMLGLVLVIPSAASAYVECGNTRGGAENVTGVRVSCSDARSFARKFASRRITRSGLVALGGGRPYQATVRRLGGKYAVRATRGSKVIRFQYRAGGGGRSGCDPNYSGACLDPNSPDYDCAGGSANGPDYTGLVHVVGDDHFDLDRDGDGVACEA